MKIRGWQGIMYSEYNILIIDDSLFLIALLKEIIKSKGLTCKTIENISEAKEVLNNHIPKIIFSDVNLPDSNGIRIL